MSSYRSKILYSIPFSDLVFEQAAKEGVPATLVIAMIGTETGDTFCPFSVGDIQLRGSFGLGQMRLDYFETEWRDGKWWDPREGIAAFCRVLGRLWRSFSPERRTGPLRYLRLVSSWNKGARGAREFEDALRARLGREPTPHEWCAAHVYAAATDDRVKLLLRGKAEEMMREGGTQSASRLALGWTSSRAGLGPAATGPNAWPGYPRGPKVVLPSGNATLELPCHPRWWGSLNAFPNRQPLTIHQGWTGIITLGAWAEAALKGELPPRAGRYDEGSAGAAQRTRGGDLARLLVMVSAYLHSRGYEHEVWRGPARFQEEREKHPSVQQPPHAHGHAWDLRILPPLGALRAARELRALFHDAALGTILGGLGVYANTATMLHVDARPHNSPLRGGKLVTWAWNYPVGTL